MRQRLFSSGLVHRILRLSTPIVARRAVWCSVTRRPRQGGLFRHGVLVDGVHRRKLSGGGREVGGIALCRVGLVFTPGSRCLGCLTRERVCGLLGDVLERGVDMARVCRNRKLSRLCWTRIRIPNRWLAVTTFLRDLGWSGLLDISNWGVMSEGFKNGCCHVCWRKQPFRVDQISGDVLLAWGGALGLQELVPLYR